MLIGHLALHVRDPQASAEFYLSVVGLDGAMQERPWGCRIDLADGFMLALIRGEPLPAEVVGHVHFGCALPDRAHVLDMRGRLQKAGVREVEWEDEGGYTGVKVEDPDGYIVELSYDTT
jgi:catechol 2,3-dioxygenase-like lactoylglutathione lyase family enzyme